MPTPEASPAPDFGRRAESYDRIRPVDEGWWELFELVVREADLLGRRVLDVGCGTGRLERALGGRARVWGIDAEPKMVDVAKRNVPDGTFRVARAEALPFKDGWFERAVMWLSMHLVERERAFAEIRRVLAPGGRLAIVSFDREHFTRYWLNDLFPSIAPIDLARFPENDELAAELRAAGFERVGFTHVQQSGVITRDEALDRIRGRHISTFDLLPEEELRTGTERAERELPDELVQEHHWLVAVAE